MASPSAQPIKIAIMAMGGEGGGVLADWIVSLAESQNYLAQTTSVPGVAQRTGATIYYVELFPQTVAAGRQPVLALMPLPGDVDIVLASELMEAGRAVQRGLVTNDRTTLLASTHRVYAMTEKTALADGRVDSTELLAHIQHAAHTCIAFDMAQLAKECGSVISAVLFGALAGAKILPFQRAAFEQTIQAAGVGVKSSLAAFAAGLERAQLHDLPGLPAAVQDSKPLPTHATQRDIQALLDRVHTQVPPAARRLAIEGLRRLVDYQDTAYAVQYLDMMQPLVALDSAADAPLATALARHLALWMSYEDIFRVAQLKTRSERFQRVRVEANAQTDQLLAIDEYFHPRLQEIAEALPAAWGRWFISSQLVKRLLGGITEKGRIVRTTSLRYFVLLWSLGQLRRTRRQSLRFATEQGRMAGWLQAAAQAHLQDPALALEVVLCQQLIKGYSDTYERGVHKFDLLMALLPRFMAAASPLQASHLAALRTAALADDTGKQLAAATAQLPH